MKIYLASFLLLAALTLTGCSYNKASEKEVIPADNKQQVMYEENLEQVEVFTIAEVAKHASAEDCWLLINDRVYDVTSYIAGSKHPGGAAILQGCGQENGTELFFTRPMGSGTAHSEGAQGYLENFYIGDLQK